MAQSPITIDKILKEAQRLSSEELNLLRQKIIEIQADRLADSTPLEEVLLLEKIRLKLPVEVMARFRALKEKHLSETISADERVEYLELIDTIEQDNVEKVKHVGALALLRNRPILELGRELGVFPRSNLHPTIPSKKNRLARC